MSLGTNYARSSRKTYLINLIAATRGEVPSEAEIKRLRRKSIPVLEEIYLDEKMRKASRNLSDQGATDSTYWIHFRAVRPGDDYFEITSDDGVVKTFDTHAEAVAWCESSGETYHDNFVNTIGD